MAKRSERIVLDTNLWISFLITKDFSKLDNMLLSKRIVLVFSRELIYEFITVANRPKFRKYFSQSEIEDILKTIGEYAEFVTVETKTTICRDPKDNFLLSLSIDGEVDYLVTGDSDLLELKEINKTKIITITNYLNRK